MKAIHYNCQGQMIPFKGIECPACEDDMVCAQIFSPTTEHEQALSSVTHITWCRHALCDHSFSFTRGTKGLTDHEKSEHHCNPKCKRCLDIEEHHRQQTHAIHQHQVIFGAELSADMKILKTTQDIQECFQNYLTDFFRSYSNITTQVVDLHGYDLQIHWRFNWSFFRKIL